VLSGAVLGDELLEVIARDQPAGLPADLKSFEFAGSQVTTDRFDVQVQLRGYLLNG
jgi:hypothetical protein